jgi:hypothetical protein
MCSEVKTTGPNLAEDVYSSFYAAAWSERGAPPIIQTQLISPSKYPSVYYLSFLISASPISPSCSPPLVPIPHMNLPTTVVSLLYYPQSLTLIFLLL